MPVKSSLKFILTALSVLFLDTCLASFASAMPSRFPASVTPSPLSVVNALTPPDRPKSYAIFVASFNPITGDARGGIAGSAFFVSSTKAITAYHVLQAKSFDKPTEFTQTQIWLVHESEPAIEINLSNLDSNASADTTSIHLSANQVDASYVFEIGKTNELKIDDKVETDGFIASSTGPVLAPIGNGRLRITSVPHLERLHVEGNVVSRINVSLTSNDVNLKQTPCVQLSYKPVVGLSGGPVISGHRVVGMNSFADPQARASTWAVDVTLKN
jgi:hypothetical protein